MIPYKTTNKLFNGKYQYKIVLIVPGASMFRSGKMDVTFRLLNDVDLTKSAYTATFYRANIKTPDDLDYCFRVCKAISKLEDIHVRVESPWVAVYTNSKKDVDKLVKLDESRVKYISAPAATLEEGTIILPKVDFEFKVTLGRNKTELSAFINWAETNSKVKLTKGCIKHLTDPSGSWGGSYFYITGDKNLLVAKMHLGGIINKIERVLKA